MPDEVPQPVPQPTPQPASQSQVNNPAPKPHNWKRLILIIVFIVGVVAVISVVFWFFVIQSQVNEKTSNDNIVFDRSSTADSVLVLLDTYKRPDDKYTIYRVKMDGSGEREIWSNTSFNDYQFSPIDFPKVSNSGQYLLYDEEKEFLIIDSVSGKERRITKNHPELFGDCVWNNSDTHIACSVRENKSTDFDQLLIVVDIKTGDESIINNSLEDKLVFTKDSSEKILSWSKNDQNIFIPALRGDKAIFLSVNVSTKKVTTFEIGDKSIISFHFQMYTPALNKFVVHANREKTYYLYNPENGEKEILYKYTNSFIGGPILLSRDGMSVLLKENDFDYNFNNSTEPKDGKPTTKIIKIDLVTKKVQELSRISVDSRENLKDSILFSVLKYWDSETNNLVFWKIDSSDPFKSDSVREHQLYSYNLDKKQSIKIFSRSSTDFPDQKFQIGVQPERN